MGVISKDKQEWTSPYAERLAQTLKPSSRVLRYHKSNQQVDSNQGGFTPSSSQEPNSQESPNPYQLTTRTQVPVSSQSGETSEVREDQFKVTPETIKKLHQDLSKTILTPKKKTSKKQIRRSHK